MAVMNITADVVNIILEAKLTMWYVCMRGRLEYLGLSHPQALKQLWMLDRQLNDLQHQHSNEQ